jgi:hypothetical protein
MAGRPPTPAKVLEMRGAFKKHPERRREDLDGVGPFDSTPPTHLDQALVPYWREVVQQINPIVLTASDSMSIEVMAGLLQQWRVMKDKAIATELRQWFAQYGLTAVGRARLGGTKKPAGGNKFRDA